MAFVAKHTPGSGFGYTWRKSGDVVDVDNSIVSELVRAGHGDFYEVDRDPAVEEEAPTKTSVKGENKVVTPESTDPTQLEPPKKSGEALGDSLKEASPIAKRRGRPSKKETLSVAAGLSADNGS